MPAVNANEGARPEGDANEVVGGLKDQRLAQMIQAMSTFGVASSAGNMAMHGLEEARNLTLHALT